MYDKADKIYRRVFATLGIMAVLTAFVAIFQPIEFVWKPNADSIGIVYDSQRNIVDVVRDDVYIETWDKYIEYYPDYMEYSIELNAQRQEEFGYPQDFDAFDSTSAYEYFEFDSVIAKDLKGFADYGIISASLKLTLADAIAYLNSRPAEEKMLDIPVRDHTKNNTDQLTQIVIKDLTNEMQDAAMAGVFTDIAWAPTGFVETKVMDEWNRQFLEEIGAENVQFNFQCERTYYEPTNLGAVQDELRTYLKTEFGVEPRLHLQVSEAYTAEPTTEPCEFWVMNYPEVAPAAPEEEPSSGA